MTRTQSGADEYSALTRALEYVTPSCHDDWRYLADRHEIDADDLKQMRDTCRTHCPIFALCEAYARAAKPNACMWAGRYWGRKERSTT